MATNTIGKKACVVGGTGYVGSLLVKHLLLKGYAVNTTVRNPDNAKRISHLVALQSLGELKIFEADLTDEDKFDAPIAGCDVVFHVATPLNVGSEDPENELIKPAIQGVHNVLKAVVRAKSVKRVVYTSSAAALAITALKGPGLVLDETNWTDIEYLETEKPPGWGYSISKALAEKTAWKFAEENHIDLVTVIPTLLTGPAITPDVPATVDIAMALLTGKEFFQHALRDMQLLSGSINITHVEDICRAHIFLAEKESARGRYLCAAYNTSLPELANLLQKRYPQYKNIPTQFPDCPSVPKLTLSSDKLIKEGFDFKYGIEEILDQSVEFLKTKGVLNN